MQRDTVQVDCLFFPLSYCRVSHKKGINKKKLLIGSAHGFNSQFLILFGSSISFFGASFNRFGCIWVKLQQFLETYMYVLFKCAYSVEKQPLNFRNASVSHCFRNLSLSFEMDQVILITDL